MLLHSIGKRKAKLRVALQFFREMERRLVRLRHSVVVQVMKNLFAIPNQKLEGPGWRAPANRVPVFVFSPILIAGVVVEQKVIDVLSDIQEPLQLFILLVPREPAK